MAGYRRPRLSRAERLVRPGRALGDHELGAVWRAFAAAGDPIFTAYLKVLLLTGQRRTETVLMRWADLDLEAAVWSIPAEATKSGRAHRVPLPPPVLAVLAELPRLDALVFPGRGRRPISGFTKRLAAVQAAAEAEGIARFTLHDLRRTYRTGLGRLGVAPHIAELLVNHALSDDLAARYDMGDHWPARVEAAERWAKHVMEREKSI
jgi:integrase